MKTEQEPQPATCGECQVPGRADRRGVIILCPLHAQAKALLEALEAAANRMSSTADYISRQEPGKVWVEEARFPVGAALAGATIVEGTEEIRGGVTTHLRCFITSQEANDKLYGQGIKAWVREARAAIAAAQPKHAAQEEVKG